MIVVAIIGLLAAIAIPNFVHARAKSQANACINNLRQIDAAAQQCRAGKRQTDGATINYPDDLTPYIKLNSAGSIPRLPGRRQLYMTPTVGGDPELVRSSTTVDPPHAICSNQHPA